MNDEDLAWLTSDEGLAVARQYARPPILGPSRRVAPAIGVFAHILPDPGDDGTPPSPLGVVDPAHDPCGRPPLGRRWR